MREQQALSQSAGSPSKIRSKTFVLVGTSRDQASLAEAVSLLESLGGVVTREVTPRLDYLIVRDRRPNRPTAEERQALALNEAGATIEILDWSGFRDLISPTPEEALLLLRGGDEGLAQWRRRRDDQARAPIDLSGVDLRGTKLTGIILYRVKMDGADLSGADLSGSGFEQLNHVNLDGALLCGAYVPHLVDCTARKADFSNVRFNPAVIVRTDFTGAKLTDVEGSYTRSEGAVFRNADLTHAELRESTFFSADFAGANLTRSILDECDFTGANFRGANLSQASLCRANLTNADLRGANLTGANLAGADLTGTKLEGANFKGTRLYAAKLSTLGPGRPLGFVPPAPVALERIGPNMRQLERIRNATSSLRIALHVDPDRRGSQFIYLHIENYGRSFRAFSSEYSGHRITQATPPTDAKSYQADQTCQASTLCEAMLELAQLWPDAELYLETLRVAAGDARETPKELREVALAAWHEAFAVPLPSLAERKARQKAERQRFLDLLRGGPEGIQQWNALRSETLSRAGHFRRADLANLDLRGANLGHHLGSCLGGLDFQSANFTGVNLTGGHLHDCYLMKACFRNAVLDGINCAGSNLRQADFEGASLKGCNLRGSRCRGTNFKGANLSKADFCHADLRGADLSSAELKGAKFEQTKYDATTQFPEGFVVPVKPAKGQPPPSRPSELEVGTRVRLTAGAFTGLEGVVTETLDEAGQVRVQVTIFGRSIAMELEYEDVDPI